MDSLHEISRAYRTAMLPPVSPNQTWCPCAPESTQLPIQQVPSEATCRKWQCEVQGPNTPYAQRRGVSIGTALNYGGFSSLEHGSVYSSSSTRWLIEESSVGMPSWNQPFRSLDHPSSLNSTSPAIPNIFNMNPSTIVAGIGTDFDWSASGAMVNFEAIYQSQSNVKNETVGHGHNNLMEHNQTQRVHEGQIKREDDRPLSTLFDLPRSRTAETQASAHVVRSGSRYICGICFKTHTRPSRAIACENEHLGYQPFVCDGTCGDPGCCASFANKEHLQTHKLPYSKTHVACQICGKHGWRRNAERHLRSCLSRHRPRDQ